MLENDNLKCVKCGDWATPDGFNIEGFEIRGWKCKKCGEGYLHPGDAQRVLAFNKFRNEIINSKLSYSGNSIIVRLPKKIVNALGLEKGEEIELHIEGPNKISIILT